MATTSDEIIVRGWAVDQPHQSSAAALDVVIDDHSFRGLHGVECVEAEESFGFSAYRNSGFDALIPPNRFGQGHYATRICARFRPTAAASIKASGSRWRLNNRGLDAHHRQVTHKWRAMPVTS